MTGICRPPRSPFSYPGVSNGGDPGLGNPGFSEIATQTLPENPPSRPPKLPPADLPIVLCTPIHSHTRRGGSLAILKEVWGGVLRGGKGGWRFMKTRGFQFLNPGFRNLRPVCPAGCQRTRYFANHSFDTPLGAAKKTTKRVPK